MQETEHINPVGNSIELTLSINPTLHDDLMRQAQACDITPARYAAEVVESFVATRRLEILRQDALAKVAEP